MRFLHTLVLLLSCVLTMTSQHDEAARSKYVWAPNGLNVRKTANVKSPRIGVVYYGERVELDTITNEFITEVLLHPAENSEDKIFIRSRWVKIKTLALEGFVIDSYLFDFPCPRRNEILVDYIERMEKLYGSSPYHSDANGTKETIQYDGLLVELQPGKQVAYSPKKLLVEQEQQQGHEILLVEEGGLFRGFTIQEVLVFLNPFYRLELKGDGEFKVIKNGATEVKLSDESRKEMWLKKYDEGFISFYYEGGC